MLNVDRRWVDEDSESFWSICVDYLETGQYGRAAQGGASERGRVDYREVLSPEQFALFVKLRALRQGIAKDEAVPVYTGLNELTPISDGLGHHRGREAGVP